jgi:hypothetical protein
MTQYAFKPAGAFAGMLADLGHRYVRSALNEAGEAVEFGIAVKRGSADDSFTRLEALTDEIAGILVHQHAVDQRNLDPDNAEGVPEDAHADLLVEGVINVKVEQAVTPDDDVYVRFDDDGDDDAVVGAFRTDGDGNTARRVYGARYLTSADAGGIAQVQFSALTDAAMHDVLESLDEMDSLS